MSACSSMSNSANSSWRTVCMPLWKFLAASSLSKSARGSGAPVSTCARHVRHDVPLPAEILHDLAGQLDRVPLDALDARDARDLDPGQQLVQPVAELVEDRDHLVVRERRGLAVDRRRQVAGEVGDRMLDVRAGAAAVDRVVHPRAALLVLARVHVEVELPEQRAVAVGDVEKAHARRATSARADSRIAMP